MLILLLFLILGMVLNSFFFYLVSWRHLLSGSLLGLLGYLLGGCAAVAVRMERRQVVAVAIETALQNGGLAYVVLNVTLDSPYSDMAIIVILAHFFCTAGPLLFIIYMVVEGYTRFSKGRGTGEWFDKVETDDDYEEKFARIGELKSSDIM